MKDTIVMFYGNLNTLNVFTNQMKKGFEHLGYEIYLFDLNQSLQSLGHLYAYMQNHTILAMIGFNNAFFGLKTESGRNVWEQLGIPCINILVDHPFWYRDILINMPRNSAILCIDRNHMNFVNRFYQNIAVNGFLAHGGTQISGKPKSLRERSIDVLYAGSLYYAQAESQKPDFSQWKIPAEMICEKTIMYLLDNAQLTIEDVFEMQIRELSIQVDEGELAEYMSACGYIERVVSSKIREKCLKTIAKSGISLVLFGNGWEQCEWVTLPNVQYGGMITPEAVLEKMEDAKIVLNTLPWFKDGTHERVFNGMLRGSVVVSESSKYLCEIIPPTAWCPFEITDEEELPMRIKRLLNDIEKAQKIADEGYRIAKDNYTWEMRAKEIHDDILQYL